MFVTNLNRSDLDAAVAANNERLLADRKIVEYTQSDIMSGEVLYIENFVSEPWEITKNKGRNSTYYRLTKSLVNEKGKKITLRIDLNDEQVEAIQFNLSDKLQELILKGKQTISLKTRAVYGFTDFGGVWILLKVRIDKIKLQNFLSDSQVSIIMNSVFDSELALPLCLDKQKDKEKVSLADLEEM